METKENKLNLWWNSLDFETMEKITNFCPYDFSEEDGYQDFVDACDEFWDELPYTEKLEIYEMYN